MVVQVLLPGLCRVLLQARRRPLHWPCRLMANHSSSNGTQGSCNPLMKDEYGAMDSSGETYRTEEFSLESGYVHSSDLPKLRLCIVSGKAAFYDHHLYHWFAHAATGWYYQ